MRAALAIGVLVGLAAYAGTQGAAVVAGAGGPAPAASSSLGVDLGSVVGCRCSLILDAGNDNVVGRNGFNATGYVVPFYYDAHTLWTEGNSSLRCAIEAKLDGGKILGQTCPDIPVAARFGRILCAGYGITGQDAGTGADQLVDAGPGPQPIVRTDCWGPNLVTSGQ
jgi:hypothetical protein